MIDPERLSAKPFFEFFQLRPINTLNVPDIYNFRSSKQFYIPKFRTNRFRNTFIMSSLLNE